MVVKPDIMVKETDTDNMDDKINPSGNWVALGACPP